MKIRQKNPALKETIGKLCEKGTEGAPLWKAIARGLNRPRRVRYEADLKRIERFAKPKETVIVPGVVLSSGDIKRPITVAALRFTSRAREKIEKAGGECLSIEEIMEKRPSKARIMG